MNGMTTIAIKGVKTYAMNALEISSMYNMKTTA